MEIPKIAFPKESMNEDPAADSIEDWTEFDDFEAEEIVTKE